jgi:beta-N-acetylhexosaminidase
VLAALAAGPVAPGIAGFSAAGVTGATAPTLAQLVGQKLVVAMTGHRPSRALLGRVRRGEIGGVCLLSSNITTPAALKALTAKLQHAAATGGQPPLLIAVDQEGGSVKRVPWAPPTLTVPQMGSINSTDVAHAQGAKTATALRKLGINVDFAPVADIPRSTASFMYQQGRTFSFQAGRTARLADAFAMGLESHDVIATMKHFPGIGLAIKNTDHFVDTVSASRAALSPDLRPYRRAIADDVPMIMLSNVTYTAYDRKNAAGWSHAIAVKLLRQQLGFTGVTITDSLSGTSYARRVRLRVLAIKAAMAGTDMILLTGPETASSKIFTRLLEKAESGRIGMAMLQASYARILSLKASL